MSSRYALNSVVQVSITANIESGLLGVLADGTRAVIRARELSWERPEPLGAYVGRTLAAMVIGYEPTYQEVALSPRLAQYDPWAEVPSRYAIAQQVTGKVVGLIESAAFVAIEPGIDGYLPLSDLPIPHGERIEQWLWLHDAVVAQITQIDLERRRLRLSVSEPVRRREQAFRRQIWTTRQSSAPADVSVAERIPGALRLQLLRLAYEAAPRPTRTLRVLVVEDHDLYGAALESFLHTNGCAVTRTLDGLEGLEQACSAQPPYDLLVVDGNLPGLNGSELIRELAQRGCSSRLVLMLNPASLEQNPAMAYTLRELGVEVFTKADSEGFCLRLLAILSELRATSVSDPASPPLSSLPQDSTALEALPAPLDLMPPPGDTVLGLQTLLEHLARDSQATTLLLLRLEPGRPRPRVEAAVGRSFPLEDAPPDILYSPLADILEKGQTLLDRAMPGSPRYERLLSLAPFEGIIGVPLPEVEVARYGLFLLKAQGEFTLDDLQRAQGAAYLLAGKLQEQHLTHVLQPWQAQNLLGQLLNIAIHEIDNKLGSISLWAHGLQQQFSELARWPEKAEDATFMRSMDEAVARIVAAQREVAGLRGQYLGLTTQDRPEWVDVAAIAGRVTDLLHSEAERLDIVLVCRDSSPEGQPARVWARPSALQQILLNLVLNALQQMQRLKRQGTVAIAIQRRADHALPVCVQVSDEGPGIHLQLWERIFDFGYTTRESGAGLGLTVARRIAQNMGGTLHVESSWMLWGTTFSLELPAGDVHV